MTESNISEKNANPNLVSEPLQKRFLFIFPVLLLIVNLVLKSLRLLSQDIGLDEPFSIYHAQFDFKTIIDQLKNYNNPPLYELLLHVWIKFFGISPLAVRTLPLLFACLSPLALYYFAKKHFSLTAAIVSSLLLSFSSLLTFYAHDSRVYSLFLLLSIGSMHFFLNLLKEEKFTAKNSVLFIAVNTLLMYAYYFGAFILFFQVIYLITYYRTKFLKFFLFYLTVAAFYLPHLFVLFNRLGVSVKNGTWLKSPSGLESLYNMLWSFSNFPIITVCCILLLIAGLFVGIKKRKTDFYRPLVLILIWFLFPFFGMFFISYWIPMYISRYLIFVLPAYYLLLVYSVQVIAPSIMIRNLMLVILVAGFAFTTELKPDKKQHISSTVEYVRGLKDSTTLVVVSPFDFLPSFAYHYNQTCFKSISDNKEYNMCDSLLKQDHVYVVNALEDVKDLGLQNYHKLVYLYIGNDQADVYRKSWEDFKLRSEKILHDKYHVQVFTK